MQILGGFTAFLLALVLLPIILVVIISFSASGTTEFPPAAWSLKWYRSAYEMFVGDPATTERFRESVVTTLLIAVTTMLLTTVVGVPASYALAKLDFRGRIIVEQLTTLPLVFPLIVLAVALLVMISMLRIELGFWRIVVGHVIITLPFVIRNCTASLRGQDTSLEEAARTLGANRVRTFLEIVLPLMRPGILAGMLLAFIISFNEFTVAYFLYTSEVFPFSIWLFQRSTTSLDATIFALATVAIILDIGLIWLLDRLVGRQGVTL